MKRFLISTLLFSVVTTLAVAADNNSLPPRKNPAKSVILIFLAGGPSQTDTFDPKPDAGRDYYGMYKTPIPTNNPNLVVNENLVELAKIADKYSIIRSMTHNSFAHEIGQYVMYTGDMSRGSIVYPAFGSTLSYMFKDSYDGALPPYISIPRSSTRFNESGFLGAEYKSFNTGGAPESRFFEVEGIVSQSVPLAQLTYKRRLLDSLKSLNRDRIEPVEEVAKFEALQNSTFELITGEARKVFDLTQESDEMRKRYGMNRIGQSCLVARRLVEAGVPVVVVSSTKWDTHKEHFKRMNDMLKELDDATSALINDLDEKGLLDETIVLMGGEFGRTPKVGWEPPWNGGRGHFGSAFSYLVAGGGFKGGEVLGETDKTGENVIKRAVYPSDFWSTVYYLMGVDPTTKLPHNTLGEVPIIPPTPKSDDGMPSEGMMVELIKAE